MDKNHILKEYDRIAKENPGIPLGQSRFEAKAQIKTYDWKKYWPRFGDLVRAAGYTPNTLQPALNEEYLTSKLVELIEEVNRFPTPSDFLVKVHASGAFHDYGTFRKRGDKRYWALKVLEYCRNKGAHGKAVQICTPISLDVKTPSLEDDTSDEDADGCVYLIKSGKYYKIGRSNAGGRREYELAIQLPEKATTVHMIQTDDPVGIEAYWHKRFDAKRVRKNAEWFDLDAADVKAFRKRRTFM